uniref:Putative GTP diphosphokinase RSH1, chloroplastic n=1 Tax=Physcomitrium patens TaxID=3218 RepID=A0A7I4B6T2_PHYPA
MTTPAGFPGHLEGIGVRNFIQPLILKTECTSSSCAWRSPRTLSGFLASTPQSSQGDCALSSRLRSRILIHCSHHIQKVGVIQCLRKGGRGHLNKNYKQSGRSERPRVTCCAGAEELYLSDKNITPITLWESLKPSISYLTKAQLRMVKDGLKLAFEAHDGQKRKSGEPFIIHPVEVARILGEQEMDWETIVAGLLHDTVEDTEHVTFERIEDQFGPAVRRIVEGETKVSKLGKMQCQNSDSLGKDVKADDLRQMFLAMTEEVRVIIVKLADRLHNMRTLSHMPPHKQKYIAMETLQVFAPLAKLLGMHRIKSELEELSFMFAYPEEHAELKLRVEALRKTQEDVVVEAKKVLYETISRDQFLGYMTEDIKVATLSKQLYSIYKKIADQKISAEEVRDIAQLRIVLKLKPATSVGHLCNVQQVCYHVLGLVHAMWPPLPQTMKDYIATPKPNGYQSLHTTVIPFGTQTYFPIEIQIRTEEMDKLAEWGIAAHHSGRWVAERESDAMGPFARKGTNGAAAGNLASNPPSSNTCLNDADIARRVSWLKSIRDWQEEFVGNMSSREFVDTVTGDLLSSRVFVFTPKGEVKNLPKGATVIDYAYQIHTDVGNKMVAAKVNGILVSPTHTLANAEVVEIVTYDGVSTKKIFQLHRQWLAYAMTRSARHKLTKFLKEQAALSAAEITADSVKEFISDLDEDESEEESSSSDTCATISNGNGRSSSTNNGDPFLQNSYQYDSLSWKPKSHGTMNGAAFKLAGDLVAKVAGGNGFAKYKIRYIQDEARASIQAWQTDRIASWQNSGGGPVQWFSVCCHDRNSMLAEVSAILVAAGIRIRACAVCHVPTFSNISFYVFENHTMFSLDSFSSRIINF